MAKYDLECDDCGHGIPEGSLHTVERPGVLGSVILCPNCFDTKSIDGTENFFCRCYDCKKEMRFNPQTLTALEVRCSACTSKRTFLIADSFPRSCTIQSQEVFADEADLRECYKNTPNYYWWNSADEALEHSNVEDFSSTPSPENNLWSEKAVKKVEALHV